METSARLREGWGFGVGAMAVSEEGGASVLLSSVVVVGVGVSLEEKRRCFDGREERGMRGESRWEAKKGACLKRERFMAFRRIWEEDEHRAGGRRGF